MLEQYPETFAIPSAENVFVTRFGFGKFIRMCASKLRLIISDLCLRNAQLGVQ